MKLVFHLMKSALHVSQSAGRALSLLDVVISDGPMTLGAAAASTDMASSTALRHLRALVASGWLAQDPDGRYLGGPTSIRLALRLLGDSAFARLTQAAQPHLDALVAATGESAYLAIRDGREAVYVAIAESSRAIRHAGWVGRSVPIEGTAVGEALTAPSPRPDGPLPLADNVGALEPDVAGVTVPVHDERRVVAALSVLGPADRFDAPARARAGIALREEAERLGAALGAGDTGRDPHG